MILGDRGDFVKNRDRDHDIDKDGFRGFVGYSYLFDDFQLTMAIIYGSLELFQYNQTL